MSLYNDPFESILRGNKVYEVRLNDEKRRNIKIGDSIEFKKVSGNEETICVQVVELRTYATFKDMYVDIPAPLLDCEGWSIERMLEETYDIYTKEQEKKWGTLAIKIRPIT